MLISTIGRYCVIRAFLITDMQSRKLNITTSGSTAVSVLLQQKVTAGQVTSRQLTVANVGDSRAVLVSSKKPTDPEAVFESNHGYIATRLSYDHSAEDSSEQQRIKDAGGFITRNRVLGILAVSRSFGDHGMKDFVIGMIVFVNLSLLIMCLAEPYVTETNLLECGDCPMLIMACDGVWDVFSDQEAADLLLEQYKTEGPFENAAHLLVRCFYV